MWKNKLQLSQLKLNKEFEEFLLQKITDEYLYSAMNINTFIHKYNITLGAFWYILKKYDLKKDSSYIQDSMKKATLEKYGVDNIFKDSNFIKKSFNDKYGVDNPGQLKEVINKREKTNLEKYGTKCTFQSPELKNKIKQTCINKYGVDNVSKNAQIKEKRKKTCLQKGIQKFEGTEVSEFLNSWQLDRKPTASDLLNYLESKDKNINLTNIYKLIINENKEEYFSKKVSYLELIVSDFLDSHNISYQKHNRDLISPLELDFYIEEYKLALEVNDIWSHNSSFGLYNEKAKDLDYHYNKTKLCEEKGIRLIHLFEPHILNEHKWKVLQDIILHVCKKSKKIYARNTELIIDKAIKFKSFFEDNNINGYRKADTAFILVDKKTKEPLMGYSVGDAYFGKGKYDAEIARGACKLGYYVVGGASKIWKTIIEYYNTHNLKNEQGQLNSIVYYVDKNYYDGSSMNFLNNVEHIKDQLGFWNYFVLTKELKNRDPKNHKKIKQLELEGKVLVVGNSGTSVNVWKRG